MRDCTKKKIIDLFLRIILFCYNALRLDIVLKDSWQSLVECTGLENRQGVKPFGGSNPSLSAISARISNIYMDKIHHLAIQVEDIGKSVDWYKENFDIQVSYQDETWAMIDFENTSLALVIPEQHPFHFAIESEEASSYGELTKHRDGTASVYIKDIDGNNIEMIKLPDNE